MDPFSRSEYGVTELTWEHGQLTLQGLGGFDGPPSHNQTNSTSTWINGADDTLEFIIHQAAFQPSSHHVTNNLTPPPVAPSQGFSTVNTTTVPIRAEGSRRCTSFSGFSGDGAGTNHQKAYANATDAKSSRDTNTYEDDHRGTRRTWDSLIKSSSSFKTKSTYEDSNLHGGSNKLGEARRGTGEEAVSPTNSTRRSSRKASVHNQSERRRRDKINQKLKTLQKLVPNASKTDKASMLDEVINYLKQLKAQVQMMNAIRNTPHQMIVAPIALQQQLLQMSLLAPMAMGAGTHNMNSVAPPFSASQSFHPGLLPATTDSPVPLRYPYNMFLAQAMNTDLYSRMAMFHHQQMSQKAVVKMNQSQMDHPKDN